MTKQLLSTLVLAIAALMGTAQDRQITLQQAVLGQGSEFRPKNLLRPAWRPGQAAFTYVERDALVQQQAANGRTDTLMTKSLGVNYSAMQKMLEGMRKKGYLDRRNDGSWHILAINSRIKKK